MGSVLGHVWGTTGLNQWSLQNSNQNADKFGVNVIKCCCVSRTVKKTLTGEETGDYQFILELV